MSDGVGTLTDLTPPPSAEAPVPKSYANAVNNRSTLSKFDVSVSVVDGKSMVTVPEEIFQDSTPLWNDFLVGRFPKAAPHVAKIHVIVNKIWNLGDKNIKIDVFSVNDTTVKFRIRNEPARLRALRRGMWNICDLPMIVSKWTPFAEEAQPEIKTMPMWVVIKNVPHSMFTWPGLSFLASPVGNPKRLHQETELVTNFEEAKIFVEVDMTKELPRTFFFKVREEEVCVTFEYPWLPPRCDVCRKWGHWADGCLANLGRCSPKKTSGVGEEPDLTITTSPKNKTTPSADGLVLDSSTTQVTLDVSQNGNGKVASVVEQEEGEIPSSPTTEAANVEGEWSTVTRSGGKNSNKQQKSPLIYGQVRIASPTQYDILTDNDKEDDHAISEQVNGPEMDPNKLTKSKQSREGITTRVPPPRQSKNSHKYLSDTSQKQKDSAPITFSRRNPQKKP